jgi:hypothetical protein
MNNSLQGKVALITSGDRSVGVNHSHSIVPGGFAVTS